MCLFTEADLISTYTTSQAIIDGELIPVSKNDFNEAGIKFPVLLTRRAWNRYVEVPQELFGLQDVSGRVWDILMMFRFAAQKATNSEMNFQILCQVPENDQFLDNERKVDNNHRSVTLKSVIGPKDINDPSPAIFIMLPDED